MDVIPRNGDTFIITTITYLEDAALLVLNVIPCET